ncbi:MAG: hypothetical protein AAF648_16425 [Pseudomonadota bacterium]
MTQRSAFQQHLAELKAKLMTRLANRLFTTRTDGLDGYLKRRFLNPPAPQPTSREAQAATQGADQARER